MIPFIVLAPLAVAGGGLVGLAQEHLRRKRQAAQVSLQTLDVSHADNEDIKEEEVPIMARGELVQIKHSEMAARVALGLSAAGMYYPPLTLVSLPVIGYSIYNWIRTRYLYEQPLRKSPMSILATLALATSLFTGHWLMASLVLTIDLASRKWLANWTKGYHLLEPPNDDDNAKKAIVPAGFMQRIRYLAKITLQGEPRWEWIPALLARVSMGLFFAISGWNKLFTVAHWKGLLSAMIATGLPFPKFMALFLASIEFYGGSLLTIGFMSTFFSIALAFAMIVAIVTVEIPYVIPPGLGPLDWLDWFLYLPQVLYVLIFLWLIIKGPGPYSVDAVIARKLGLDKDPDKEPDEKVDKASDEDLDETPNPGGASWTPAPA
jgi:putative oxidoreductase